VARAGNGVGTINDRPCGPVKEPGKGGLRGKRPRKKMVIGEAGKRDNPLLRGELDSQELSKTNLTLGRASDAVQRGKWGGVVRKLKAHLMRGKEGMLIFEQDDSEQIIKKAEKKARTTSGESESDRKSSPEEKEIDIE